MARGSERKKGFSLLPVLIILASVLIGTGSVLVLREKMNEEQGTSFKEQEDIPTNQEIINRTNSNESNSLEQSNDETSAGSFTLKSSNEENTNDNTSYDETNSSEAPKHQEANYKKTANSNDTNNGSIHLEADNDGKDELNLGKTLKIKGGEGIKTSLSNNTITVTNTGNTNNTTDYSAGTGIDIRNNIISVADSYDDNFLLTTTNFSGDITGAYNNLSVSDDSHSHTASTLPTNTSYLGQTISAEEIATNTITRANLKDSNTPIDGQVLSYNQTTGGFTWITSSGSGTVTQINSGNGLSGGPITTTGTLGINAPTCSGTDKLQWNGTAFACSADLDTDTNTTYTAGDGLDLTGTEFSTDLLSTGGLSITSTELGIKLNGSTLNLSTDGLKIADTYDDNFLTTSSSFGGDVSGAYNAIAVANDSHSHTASTLPSHDSLTGAGTIDTTLEVQGVSVGGDVSGTIGNITVSDNSHSHDTTTISGLDISSDTNLSGDTEIVLTGDALSIAGTITRDTEWNTVSKLETATSANIVTSGENISLLVNDSGYITASSSNALTNKTGNISMWTNDSAYITDGNTNWNNEYNLITLTNLSSSATGLTYTNTTGAFSLTSGYVIPTTTQETNWGTAYSKAHDQNTDSGTTQTTYQIDSDATGPKLKNNTQVLEVRNAGDTDYANLKVKDLDIEGVLQAGTSNIQLTDTSGKIQALSSTYFASLSGSNLTSLNASNISSGTIPSAQVSGSYTGITGVGTITTGTWSGTEIGVTKGGTGLTTISSGKLLYSSALNTLSELTLDTTLDISAGYLGVNETNILLSLLGGTLDDSQLPSGGDWTLTTNLNIDSNTLYINQSTNRIGIGTTNPNATLDVNGTVRAQTICDENGSNCRDLSDGWSNTSCPTGYIWVPGSAKQGTLPGFCVMKYEAKNDGSGNPVSTPTGSPWVSIYQTTAREECKSLGANYHLISDQEWMTIAENIAATTINDTDDDANPQFANGHSDNAPGSALATTSGADPVVSGCTTTQTMENAANAYSAGSCEIRGTGSGGSTDNDKGYYGTGQQWSATGYSAGAANKSQLRTHVLSNKQVIWDFPGNVWEWTNNHIYDSNGTAEMPLPAAF